MNTGILRFFLIVIIGPMMSLAHSPAWADTFKAHDPGVQLVSSRGSAPSSCPNSTMQPFDPAPLPGLTPEQLRFFCAGLEEFRKADTVKDGLGPTMNLDSCVGCHAYPAAGGTSPPKSIGNPQINFLRKYKAGTNTAPSFITADGPVREVRFIRDENGKPDGGVHSLFTITGLPDSGTCNLSQPDFAKEFKGINKPGNNAIFRIPTPLFGAGLIEQIEDSALAANQTAQSTTTYAKIGLLPVGRLNVVRSGHAKGSPNHNGNDGTIARFGWKAQNKSLLVFGGEAYNVEMGISNELFETERNEDKACQFHTVPNDTSSPDKLAGAKVDDRYDAYSDIEKFAAFMRFSAPPTPSADAPGGAASIAKGRADFMKIGCSQCHTPELTTSSNSTVAALSGQPVRLFSDLALHDMGIRLADGVSQGQAGPQEFRSAPLWGLGQRSFFLHDGRTGDLDEAIQWHASPGKLGKGGSEANPVVHEYRELSEKEKQDLLNFLRSL
jgi:CxxC motif-containing protein (DUF1111 family)